MKIVESFSLVMENKGKQVKYFYRLTEKNSKYGQAFGIEVEKQEVKDGVLTKIDRDSVDLVSTRKDKVKNLVNVLYQNTVSPIHLIDIIGEYVDEWVVDFEKQEALVG